LQDFEDGHQIVLDVVDTNHVIVFGRTDSRKRRWLRSCARRTRVRWPK
jgi:hypothetical protein